jgi:hypothetical protein
MKDVRIGTVCLVCSGLGHCEHIITIYVDNYVGIVDVIMLFLKYVWVEDNIKLKGRIFTFLFPWLIFNSKSLKTYKVTLIWFYVTIDAEDRQ